MKWPFLGSSENTPYRRWSFEASDIQPSLLLLWEWGSFICPSLSHASTPALCGSSLCMTLEGWQMKTAANLLCCLPELCFEQSNAHGQLPPAHSRALLAGPTSHWIHVFWSEGSLTPAQSSARPANCNRRTQWFNSQCIPAAAATKMQTRQFKQSLGISALRPLPLETPVQVITKLLRGSHSSQHSVLHGHKGNSTGRKFNNESKTVGRT